MTQLPTDTEQGWTRRHLPIDMEPETRQTLIGVAGQVVILTIAIHEGFNGTVTMAGVLTIGATVSPHLADRVPTWSSK